MTKFRFATATTVVVALAIFLLIGYALVSLTAADAPNKHITPSAIADAPDRSMLHSAIEEELVHPLLASASSDPCACRTPCARHRTQPQDPLPWCLTSKKCTRASVSTTGAPREICYLPDPHTGKPTRSDNVTSCSGDPPRSPRGGDGIFWRHCGAGNLWRFPAPTRSAAAAVARVDVLSGPLRFRETPPGCEAPADYARRTRHYVYQAACEPDGLGSNANNFKVGLFLARALRFKLVWNQENFVSENSPQYVGPDGALLRSLASPPSDLFHPLGLDSCAPSVPRVGEGAVSAEALFERVRQGDVIALPIADTQWESDDGVSMFASALLEQAKDGADPWPAPKHKERVVILQSCMMLNEWGVSGQAWFHTAYAAARGTMALRPPVPTLLSALIASPQTLAVVVHVRWGDVAKGGLWRGNVAKGKERDNAWLVGAEIYARMLGALFPVVFTCRSAHVVFVAQAARGDHARLKAGLLGPDGSSNGRTFPHRECSSFSLREFLDADGPESARQLFESVDALAGADGLVGGGGSMFTKLAAALMHPEALRVVRSAEAVDYTGIPNVVGACHTGAVDVPGVLARTWASRRDVVNNGPPFAMTSGCVTSPPD